MFSSRGIAHHVQGVSVVPHARHAPVERDLDEALIPYLSALRRCDGDGAAVLVLPLPDELRGRLVREMVRRPALYPAPAIRAVLACTPKPVLGRVMGLHGAAVAWRTYLVDP